MIDKRLQNEFLSESEPRTSDETATYCDFFEHKFSQKVSAEDCREIVQNLTGFFKLLIEWDRRLIRRRLNQGSAQSGKYE